MREIGKRNCIDKVCMREIGKRNCIDKVLKRIKFKLK